MARLQADVSSSLGGMKAAQGQLDSVVRQYEAAWAKQEALMSQISATQAALRALEAQLGTIRGSMNARAASTYRAGPGDIITVLMDARSFRQFATAMDIIEAVTRKDALAVKTVTELRNSTAGLQVQLDAQRTEQEKTVEVLQLKQEQMQGSLQELGRRYESIKARLDTTKSGFAFPVRAPYSYVDSWLGPRPGGRKHLGTDIFALQGTPVYSVVNGVVEDLGINTLGGNKLWIRSPGDGWRYYYAHLAGFGPGMKNGAKVKKGQVVGYVGTTGNARGTPPHLHFETHVPAGPATNPYPILKRVNPIK
ncbi:MAG: murein hydrolase activator EnvC family protein [Actinomycetota bacterium]